jgi:hypothetical protein
MRIRAAERSELIFPLFARFKEELDSSCARLPHQSVSVGSQTHAQGKNGSKFTDRAMKNEMLLMTPGLADVA